MGLPSALVEITGGRRHGAFTRREALDAGYTAGRIRAVLANGTWVRLRTGVYAEANVVERARARPDHDRMNVLLAEAAALAIEGAVISHGSAVRWWGLEHLETIGAKTQLTCPRTKYATPWSDEKTIIRSAALPALHVKALDQVRITAADRTVADIARDFGFLDGVVVGDSALVKGRTTRAKVQRTLKDMHGWPGVRQAREVAACIDARAQNPLESLCHARWWKAGFPRPELQVWIFDQAGFVGIVDGMWVDEFIAYEADGMLKYDRQLDGSGTLRVEKLRQERLENTRIVFRRYTWDEQWNQPGVCVDRMEKGFAEAERRIRPAARIYVGDKDTLAPDPGMFGGTGLPTPEALGLSLAYDGFRRIL